MQLKRKVFRGELNVLLIFLAFKDLIVNFHKLFKQARDLFQKNGKPILKISRAKKYIGKPENNPVQ
jgi:hypothetical protein